MECKCGGMISDSLHSVITHKGVNEYGVIGVYELPVKVVSAKCAGCKRVEINLFDASNTKLKRIIN